MVMSNVFISIVTMHFVYLDYICVRSTNFHVDIVVVHCFTKLYVNKTEFYECIHKSIYATVIREL